MIKCLGPYQHKPDKLGDAYWRYPLLGTMLYGVFQVKTTKWYRHRAVPAIPMAVYDTMEQAMTALDQELIEHGYTLLTQEQFDKYKLLA